MSGPESSGDDKDNAVAKTAGFVVVSGIVMSILKALNPLNKPRPETQPLARTESTQPIAETESTQTIQVPSPQSLPPKEIIIKKSVTCCVKESAPKPPEPSRRAVEIVKGDTLWGLSRKYGVTIDAIKEANGLSSDTIYAGKKLIIP